MNVKAWIQNPHESMGDYILKNGNLQEINDSNQRNQFVRSMYDIIDKGKLIYNKEFLKIYKLRNEKTFFIDIVSEDMDRVGRRGAIILTVENYESQNTEEFTSVINKTFATTNKKVSQETKNQIITLLNSNVRSVLAGTPLNLRNMILIATILLAVAILITYLS